VTNIKISKKNEVYIKLECEPHILYELQQYFTFEVPNAKFMPQRRNKNWDGTIRLLSVHTGEIYAGLLDKVVEKINLHGYSYEFVNNKYYGLPFEVNGTVSLEGVKDYMNKICSYEPRTYQVSCVFDALKYNRKLIISPTASGKSLMIYSIVRYFTAKNKNTLIVVPTTSLVEQMVKDFADYGWNTAENVHRIMQGKDKATDLPVVISTWQSAYKLPKAWFDQFDVVIGDEAHLFQAKSIQTMMTKMTDVKYRFGMTGTLADAKTHSLVLEGLFGRIRKIIKTKDLQKAGHLAKLQIKAVALKYAKDECRVVSKMKYHEEIDFLVSHKKRNIFIRNLALSLSGNTLVLFNFVEKHGNVLHRMIEEKANDKQVYYVWGGTDAELREQVREITENNNDVIIVASAGVFSTGVNIKNLHNVIFSHPGKSKIRVLQSIGRVLRTTETKESATLYDIVDDLTNGSKKNFAATHFIERHKYYVAEKFPVKLYKVEVK